MSLPWVRLDSDIATHDKIVRLLSDPSGKRYQAAASYMFALGYAGGHGTDGVIPRASIPFVHGTSLTARLLVVYRLWEESSDGWRIVNFAERQQLSVVTAGKREVYRVAAMKANCTRWHGKDCWNGTRCSREND